MPPLALPFHKLMRFLEPNDRIVMDHGSADPNDPDRFRATVTFDEQSDGKTVLTLRQLHPSGERRQIVIGFVGGVWAGEAGEVVGEALRSAHCLARTQNPQSLLLN